ncbi:hypothetical protein ACOSP7_032981 [Xanthoceras sorbifolium]
MLNNVFRFKKKNTQKAEAHSNTLWFSFLSLSLSLSLSLHFLSFFSLRLCPAFPIRATLTQSQIGNGVAERFCEIRNFGNSL